MMLHSCTLHVPLPAEKSGTEALLIRAETPSPFPIDESTGKLKPLLKCRLKDCEASIR